MRYTKEIKFIVDIRTEDIDGNKIDIETEVKEIAKAILKFWNIASLDIKGIKVKI